MTELTATLVFEPLVPLWALAALATAALASLVLGGLARLRAWALRLLAFVALLAALAGPSFRQEERERLSDIVLLVEDRSASQTIADRPALTDRAVTAIAGSLAALPNTEVRRIEVGDDAGDGGTMAVTAIARALAELPQNRVAGVIAVTDGQVHDADVPLALPAPLGVALSGHADDWDRRLRVITAPAYGIVGQELNVRLRIEEEGAMPPALKGQDVSVTIALDGAPPQAFVVPVGTDLDLPLTLDHAGQNVVQVTVAPAEGELTDRNNMAVVQINGVRDRLRVLLVSGEPYAGERTWRNLLKSDSAVDLVHFTILRPPDKEDGVPVEELALIAFPTRELFVDKIEEFDLIIFDRYPLRGILLPEYLENIRDYVLGGGAVLVGAGPDYASVDSIYFSAMGDVLPAAPTTRVIDAPFLPTISDLGLRHPVTAGLTDAAGAADAGAPAAGQAAPWGRWLRHVELADVDGDVIMQTPDGEPLLVLAHQGEGRIALLASDQAWLWGRGFEGGGPQQELLRRLSHWLMKEPELEEESLSVVRDGARAAVVRRTLRDSPREVVVTDPDGAIQVLPLLEVAPGEFRADWTPPKMGLYRLREGELETVFAVGPASPREYDGAIASQDPLGPLAQASGGGFVHVEDGPPEIRQVRAGRPAAGRGWLGITPREAYRTVDLRVRAVLPPWAWLTLVGVLTLSAWLYEGRARRQSPAA